MVSLVAQIVKNPPAMQETRVQSLDWEDPRPPEKEIATHSNILAWRIPWTEEPGGLLQSMGSRRVRQDWVLTLSLFLVSMPRKLPILRFSIPILLSMCSGPELDAPFQKQIKKDNTKKLSIIYQPPSFCSVQATFSQQNHFIFSRKEQPPMFFFSFSYEGGGKKKK